MKRLLRACFLFFLTAALAAPVPASSLDAASVWDASAESPTVSGVTLGAAIAVYKNITYASLSARQKKICDSIMSRVKKSQKTSITTTYNCTYNEFKEIWSAINNTYFRYYSPVRSADGYYKTNSSGVRMNVWRMHTDENSSVTTGIKVKLFPKISRNRYKRHLENKKRLRAIAKRETSGITSPRQKVIAINNYVCKKLTYSNNSGTLDVALRTKYAKCTGYATLFMALCEMAGLPCCLVTGYVYDDEKEGHAWNLVKIGSGWYYVDPTWNDATDNDYLISRKLWSNHTAWAKIYIIDFALCGYSSGI